MRKEKAFKNKPFYFSPRTNKKKTIPKFSEQMVVKLQTKLGLQ